MKKTLSILALAVMPLLITAQEAEAQKTTPDFSNNPGMFMFEVDLKPFDLEEVISLQNIQTKVWVSDKAAVRLGFTIDQQNNTMTDKDYDKDEESPFTYEEELSMWAVSGGIEYRILGSSRVSPYVGLDLAYSSQKASAEYTTWESEYNNNTGEYEYDEVDLDCKGGWCEIDEGYIDEERLEYKALGATLVFGTDFFITKNLYLGFEAGVGYTSYKLQQMEIDADNWDDEIVLPSSTMNDIGLRYNNTIRLGVFF